MTKSKIILIIVLILLAGNVFFGLKYFAVVKELRQTQLALAAQGTNEKVLAFTKLFIDKVLQTEQAVDFETRLQLENAVRNLGDKEILAQWQKFTDSKADSEAQKNVKSLLGMLVNKLYPVR